MLIISRGKDWTRLSIVKIFGMDFDWNGPFCSFHNNNINNNNDCSR